MSLKKVATAAIRTMTKSPRKENTLAMRSEGVSHVTPPNDWASVGAEEEELTCQKKPEESQSTQSFSTVLSQRNSAASIVSTTSEPSPCGRCRKLVKQGDCALECEVCRQWYHIKCEEVPKQQYKLMMEINQPQSKKAKGKLMLHWFCATCNCSTVDFMTGLSIQQGRLDQIERRVEGMETEAKTTKEKIEKIEERVSKIEETQTQNNRSDGAPGSSNMEGGELNQIIRKKLEEHTAEQRARNSRTNNVIVFNLPEPDGGSPQEKMNKDLDAFNKLTKEGCKNEVKKSEIEKCYRLGKQENNKTRPLLVKLKDDENNTKKKKLFLSLQTLRQHKGRYENVRIGHDLTKTQREDHKEMIEKAKKMDEEDADSENYIHLVRGPPDNLEIRRIKKKPRPQ